MLPLRQTHVNTRISLASDHHLSFQTGMVLLHCASNTTEMANIQWRVFLHYVSKSVEMTIVPWWVCLHCASKATEMKILRWWVLFHYMSVSWDHNHPKVGDTSLCIKGTWKKKSKCSNNPYSPYLQDFITVISLTYSTNGNISVVSYNFTTEWFHKLSLLLFIKSCH